MARPRRWRALSWGMLAAALFVGWVLVLSLVRFPFDPAPSSWELAFALAGVGLFLAGALLVMLARRLGQRMAGAHLMVAAAAILLIALAGGSVAWGAAILAWITVAAMSGWGLYLARGIAIGGGRRGR